MLRFFCICFSFVTLFGAAIADAGPSNLTRSQELSLTYLEALLEELQMLGQLEDDATVDTVDWSSFGITVDLETLKQRAPVEIPKRLMRQVQAGDGPIAACEAGDSNCLFGMIARFRLNINTALAITPQALCQQIMDEFAGPVETPCSEGVATSQALSTWTTSKGEESFFVMVEREDRRPPVFRVSVIGRPGLLQQQNGDHFERHDFLVNFAFYETAQYWISVTPIFAMHDLSSSALQNLMAIDRNQYSVITYSRNIPGSTSIRLSL